MANLPKGLLAGSDPKIVAGPYGPDLSIHVNGGVALRTSDGDTLAAWAGGVYSIVHATLNPKTVPYVNAFIRDHGTIDAYWRAQKAGLFPYRLHRVAGIGISESPGLWSTSGTPITTAAQAAVTLPGVLAQTPPAIHFVPACPNCGAALPQGSKSCPLCNPPITITVQPATPPVPNTVVEATVVDVQVEPPPPAPKPVVKRPITRGRKSSLKAPEGYVVIQGRNGEDLCIPERVVATFHAAVQSRFEAGLPAHPIAIGPAGTGKTESVIALAVSEGMEIAGVIQCGGIEGPADLYGQTTPDETAPHGWRRAPSALWQAMALAAANPDKRYCVVLDEVNRVGTLAGQNSLLSALDGTACLQNPATGEVMPLPPNLFVVATANIGIAYSGTIRMDAALMSRWWTNIVFGYLPENVERAIAVAIMGNDEQSRYLARAAREVRLAHGQEEFRSALVPGTREIVAVAQQARFDPSGVAGAWHDKITCSFSDDGRDKARTEQARVRVLAEMVFKSEAPVDERGAGDDES